MTWFLCHNCSNINSPSGEACIIIGPEDRKDEIIQGNGNCCRNYTIPVTEEERKESIFILPDNWDFETDFYIIASQEAEKNLDHILTSPLWEVFSLQVRPYTNEEMLWENAKKQIRKHKRTSARNERIKREIDNQIHILKNLIPCNIETDPLQ